MPTTSKLVQTQNLQNRNTTNTPTADQLVRRLAERTAEHAVTARYALDVLQVLQLAGDQFDAVEVQRIRGAALQAFRIDGLSVADCSDAVDAALAAEDD